MMERHTIEPFYPSGDVGAPSGWHRDSVGP